MPRRTDPYTFEEIHIFVAKAARLLGHRYSRWGVDADDVNQELWLWVLSHETRIRKWLASEPQQTTRIFRSLYDYGSKYAEKEKAQRLGYHQDDVQWYTPSLVESLLPFALEGEWNGLVAEHGEAKQNWDLITMVQDVRKAMDKTHTYHTLRNLNPGDGAYEDAVRAVVDALGGTRSYTGRRKVISNSTAQHIDDWEQAS
jgi:hypothetical protein